MPGSKAAELTPGEGAASQVALRVRGLSKAFGGTRALDGASWALERGTIHALVGGNGSGKSVTIKILAGVYIADTGEIEVAGRIYDAPSFTPARARELGLRFVHQQNATFPDLTVAENLAAGHGFETTRLGRIRWPAVRRRAAELLERFEVEASPDMQMADLGPASQTMVAIARALQDQDEEGAPGMLVLDEPTAALPAAEARMLLDALTRYAAAGQTILYVTHRLEEVVEIADRATILRDGRVVETAGRGEFDHDSLVRSIMGRTVDKLAARQVDASGEEVRLRAKGLGGGPVRDASLALHAGEIVGVAGLLGSGRSSLLRLLFGLRRPEAGEIEIGGERVQLLGPSDAIARGVAYVPEDRARDAAFGDLELTENMGMACTTEYFRGGLMRHRRERHDAEDLMSSYLIKAASPAARFTSLSGGNQQKAIMARWLRRSPSVLLLDEPTQGVDVGARLEIWQLVRRAVEAGGTALVVSSDLEELAAACDRVLVMRAGRIVAEVSGSGLDPGRLDELTMARQAAA
jgi:ribose transport system ATP-binding protein